MTAFTCFAPPRLRLRLSCGALRAEVWPELGGALASLERLESDSRGTAVSRALLRGANAQPAYTPMELACWPLVPYANRLRDGHLDGVGGSAAVPANFPGQAHPLHGVGWLGRWSVIACSAARCSLQFEHLRDRHWPWSFSATLHYQLDPDALLMSLEAENRDSRPMPVGLGWHPYIFCPEGTRLQLRASAYWRVDEAQLPVARATVPSDWELAAGMSLDRYSLDNCFEVDERSARVLWPDGAGLEVRFDRADYLHVYHPPDAGFVCLEPVTHLPDVQSLSRRHPDLPRMPVLAPGTRSSLSVWLRPLAITRAS